MHVLAVSITAVPIASTKNTSTAFISTNRVMLTPYNCSAVLHSCFSSDVIFTDSDLCGQDFAQWHVESHIAHLDMVPFLFKGLVPFILAPDPDWRLLS